MKNLLILTFLFFFSLSFGQKVLYNPFNGDLEYAGDVTTSQLSDSLSALNYATNEDISDSITIVEGALGDSVTLLRTNISDTADVLRSEWGSDISDSVTIIESALSDTASDIRSDFPTSYNFDSIRSPLLKVMGVSEAKQKFFTDVSDSTDTDGVDLVFDDTNLVITNREGGYIEIDGWAVYSDGTLTNMGSDQAKPFHIQGDAKIESGNLIIGTNGNYIKLDGGGNPSLIIDYNTIYNGDSTRGLSWEDEGLEYRIDTNASGVYGTHNFKIENVSEFEIKKDTIDCKGNILTGVKTATGNDTTEAVNVAYFDRLKTGFNSIFDSTSAPISLSLTTTPSHFTNSNNDLWAVNNITDFTYSNDTITYDKAYVYDCELEVTLTGISGIEIIIDIYNITDDNIIRKSVWRMFGNTEQITIDVNYKDFDADVGDKIVPRIYLESGASTVNIDSGTLQIDYHSNK